MNLQIKLGDCVRTHDGHCGKVTKIYHATGLSTPYAHIQEADGRVWHCFLCDPEKNTSCEKTMCYVGGGECRCTTRIECSVNDKILWPALYDSIYRAKVGCERCPLGTKACDAFRRHTHNGECPCDVFDTDYLEVEDNPIE